MSDKDILDEPFVKRTKKHSISIALIVVFAIFFLLGVLFRLQHYPFSNELLFMGCGGLSGYLLGKSIFIKGTSKLLLIAISIVVSILLVIRYQNYLSALILYAEILFVSFVIAYVLGLRIKRYNERLKEH